MNIVTFINSLTSTVGGWTGLTALFTGIIELIVRIWPTENPTSLLLVAASILKSLGTFCTTVSQFLDGILQNTKR